jgi:hypothetical protein
MAETIYFGHYRVCTNDQGAPEEVSRSGAAINNKAVDLRSGELVMLQLIPLAAIDPSTREQFEQRAHTVEKLDHINIARIYETGVEDDRFVMASEYLAGETADSWVITHGPIAPDAVFRVALQVVRAIAAAAFHGLTHRAIQPSNLMLLSDAAPEGGWPLVKLLNFGIAGLELHSESDEARELAPSLPLQFASPEQLRGGEIDFRSEVYSLGATMCFLLAGAVPLAASGKSVRARLRSLPELRRTPRRFRKLLGQMLEENPNQRPQDPVALEKEIQKALGVALPGQPIVRALTPVAPVLPEPPPEGPAPVAQVWRGVLAVAALLLIGGMVAVLLSSNAMPWRHRRSDMGKPVGVPERSTSAAAQPNTSTVAAANQAVPQAAPEATAAQNPSPEQAQETEPQKQSEAPAAVAAANATNTTAESVSRAPAPPAESNSPATTQQAETRAPAAIARRDASNGASTENSAETGATAEKSEAASAETSSDRSESHKTAAVEETKAPTQPTEETSPAVTTARSSKKKTHVAKIEEKPPKAIPIDPAVAAQEDEAIHRAGQVRAQFVGMSGDGRLLLRLPSGKIVTVTPRNEQEHAVEPRRHRRPTEPEEYPRAEPVNPDEEPQD